MELRAKPGKGQLRRRSMPSMVLVSRCGLLCWESHPGPAEPPELGREAHWVGQTQPGQPRALPAVSPPPQGLYSLPVCRLPHEQAAQPLALPTALRPHLPSRQDQASGSSPAGTGPLRKSPLVRTRGCWPAGPPHSPVWLPCWPLHFPRMPRVFGNEDVAEAWKKRALPGPVSTRWFSASPGAGPGLPVL